MMKKRGAKEIRQAVKEHYGTAIRQQNCCCGSDTKDSAADGASRSAHRAGYTTEQLRDLPEGVISFGCGNPVNFMDVKPGDVVLDLGSGAGLDMILAAEKVGPSGRVIGLDMTPEMIETCRANLSAAGVTNAEVRQGEMEDMPVADGEVDWVISNCVINLSPEKDRVFAEAWRVLKPGGRLLVSDIVTLGLPDECRDDITAWVGCIAGAVEEDRYVLLVREAGFEDIGIIDKVVYDSQSLHTLADDACGCGAGDQAISRPAVDSYIGRVASIRLSARKPG